MATCRACSEVLTVDGVACDGVCGGLFHASCLRRATRASAVGNYTCGECSDIKPCHVLRLVRGMFEAISSDQSLIADRINTVSSNWACLQLFSEDSHALLEKMDRLIDLANGLASSSTIMLEKTHEVSSKLSNLSGCMDDFHSSFVGPVFAPSAAGAHSPSAIPILDDIRRGIRQVKGDFTAWSSAVAANSELINSIASDVRGLVSRGLEHPSPPLPVATLPDEAQVPASLNVDTLVPSNQSDVRNLTQSGLSTCLPSPELTCDPVSSPIQASNTSGAAPPISSDASGAVPSISSAISQPISPMPDISATAQSGHRRRSRRRRRAGHNRASQSTADAAVALVPGSSRPPLSSEVVSLRPARRHRCVFVSRVDPDTTEDEIIQHISSHIGVPREVISCRRLGSSRNRVGCSFTASFRVFVPEDMFSAVVSSDTWPDDSIVREFLPRQRPSALSKNSLVSSPSTTPT